MSQAEARGLLRNDFAVLIDVRDSSVIHRGMVAKSKNVPASTIATPESFRVFADELPKDKQILVIGDEASPSGPIAQKLAEAGFKVGDLGLFSDWMKSFNPPPKK